MNKLRQSLQKALVALMENLGRRISTVEFANKRVEWAFRQWKEIKGIRY